jgi:hypothetical protein
VRVEGAEVSAAWVYSEGWARWACGHAAVSSTSNRSPAQGRWRLLFGQHRPVTINLIIQ